MITIIKNVTNNGLTCELDGIPKNYRYKRWHHLSEFGQLIRLLPNNQTLCINPTGVNIDTFKLNGKYVCNAENGIPDENGSIIQSEKVSVLLQGKHLVDADMISIFFKWSDERINFIITRYKRVLIQFVKYTL